MVCESCNQNPATVHVTDLQHGGTKKEVHVCADCAEKHGMTPAASQNMPDLLYSLMDPSSGREIRELLEQKCPECGISYPEFRTRGRLGCSECYETFRKGLEPLLEKIHGSTRHVGRVPSCVGEVVEREKDLRRLRIDLDKAVKLEEYERAAEIRDRIREMESAVESGSDDGGGDDGDR